MFKKLWMLLKYNKAAKIVIEEVQKSTEVAKRTGYQSTEFWMTALASMGAVGASLNGVIPPVYAAVAVSASAIAYTLSRGIAKSKDASGSNKRGLRTTELWIGLSSDLGAFMAALGGIVSPEVSASLILASRIAYSLSRGLAKKD